jgi:TetR/AcrR family transcriptional regulator, regulator of cefoperazone and chloramphenicol sensitivity
MSDVKMDKRPYHSPLRAEQALATRGRILDAALELFAGQGYGATSIASIARTAGVVPETIYATFGSKRGIVDGLVERVAPPKAVAELGEAWTAATGDPAAQLGVLARFSTAFWAKNDALATVFRRGIGDSDISDEWSKRQSDRRGAYARLLSTWPRSVLREPLDLDGAVDIAWALASDDLFHLLVRDRGWTTKAYEAWLDGALRRELLAD